MKISEVTDEFIYNFAKLDQPTKEEIADIEHAKAAAMSFIRSYTSLDDEDIDNLEDLTEAYLLLIIDFFDNRNYQMSQKQYSNVTVTTILNMHRRCLL